MDQKVKQAAVAKYSQILQSGASLTTVKEAISKEFKGSDVDEICDALPHPDNDLPDGDRRNRPGEKPDQGLPGGGGGRGNRPNQDLPDEGTETEPQPK